MMSEHHPIGIELRRLKLCRSQVRFDHRASRGIGRGIALKLAEQGVKIAVHYYRNESAANDTLSEIRKRGSDGFIVQADVCRMEEITRMIGEVKKQFGKLDILVCNARPEASE